MKTRILIVTTLLLFFCWLPVTADTGTSTAGMFYLTVKMFSVLAVVIGIMLLCLNLLKKYVPRGNMLFSEKKFIKIIETHYFDPKKSIVLLKVASEYLLVAVAANEIRFLKNIDLSEVDTALVNGPEIHTNKNDKVRSIFKKLHLSKK